MQCPSFSLVQSKRNKKKKHKKNQKPSQNFNTSYTDTVTDDYDCLVSSAIERINETQVDLETSDFYKDTVQKIKSIIIGDSSRTTTENNQIEQIICFGIGCFASCSIARHQLAYILAVSKEFNIETIEFHDPALTLVEKSILTELNCKTYSINLEGKLLIDHLPTLLYLPHCPKQLTNNLLWRNWNSTALQHVKLLIGNSFESIIESTPERFLQQDAEYLLKLFPHTKEIKLPNNFRHTDIFNDLSIHCFDIDKVPADIWSQNTEPKYLDSCIELITNLEI